MGLFDLVQPQEQVHIYLPDRELSAFNETLKRLASGYNGKQLL